jgi:hypothetical protein
MLHGGRRPQSGRRPRDTVLVARSILRLVYRELIHQEELTGVYCTQIVAGILTEHLIGGIAERELADVRSAPRLETAHGLNGSNGEKRLLNSTNCSKSL